MLSHRSIGIRTLCLFWQMVLVTLTFWGWLFIWLNEECGDRRLLERYLLYNEFMLVGLVFGARKRADARGPHREWIAANRQSARQAFLGIFFVFLVVVAFKDLAISRSYLLSYIAWLYLTLLFTNYWLPRGL